MRETTTAAQDEVVQICQDLIRIDTSNFGDGSGPGEAEAAAYVVQSLREVGLEPQTFESDPGRVSVVVRIPGADRERGALCIHGHLDVVPANAADWSVDPFSGELRDGCVWGRGAVDMKDMDAMILACVRDLARTGTVPPRDLVIVFFADEEAGGRKGSHFLVEQHPEVFDGVTEAISEVGGYSVTVTDRHGDERRTYLLQTAEKGICWLRLTAHGRAGHGSVPNDENAIVRLAEAISRIAAHTWPREFIPSVRTLLEGLGELTGTSWSDEDLEDLLDHLRGAQGFVRGTLQDTSNVTMLDAGYKHNVIPQHASANVDCRFLPGHEEQLLATITELAGEHVSVEVLHRDIALDAPFEGDLVEAMVAALRTEDPDAVVLPYCLSGGTDNKALSLLGITGYGFAPLRLPADLDFAPMFHGVDERVPVDALQFGARVLGRLIATC
ncbi:MAG TPA: M20/M25/M40 family metallo-hydrolase [Ornithinibacter sp.]|jgi:acetylornithine deacetylase/succinyl-diaminopimelate desuccinylase-like protein|uniref:M20/M25/M40 family metallo-hydrolase n=1 Tax=Ornithinibacter sp. TaxID=2862748 RepID=UPI002B75F12D|nr:M20/M25/M40 family metallo-hydrolase [Ornithinibacter sp.]HNV41828.1 M20/M25/M40 family metallo-hydrolase [Ornithinibacter sp.]HOT56711.1 M20/M25/M40 family metallo-hydrolase [Ornithinibacter sp.]HPV90478.1 M20/M25/M40 family metallo-hydrolase [Ornithinibacter sp.]HQG16579.1 M20/M25/M40 family metallo-hydrolase [Ornithinibacter sp.]HQW72532.1 M20/M25/M40 family metallo-hydrolase [Ornithinibacter sp.]